MKAISRSFLRELKLIDPALEVRYNPTVNYFEITKMIDVRIPKGNGKYRRLRQEAIQAVFDHLNDSALTDLRRRQYLARLHNAKGDPDAYLKLVQRQNKEAKLKEHRRGQELVQAGIRKMYMVGRQKYYT